MHTPPDTGMAGKPFRATYIWTNIINNLQTQVEVKRRRHNLKIYPDCFLGSEAVDVVLAHIIQSKVCGDAEVPRFKAVRLCQALMEARVFEAVDTKVFGKEKRQAKFEDSSCSLYRFLNRQTPSTSGSETIGSGYNTQRNTNSPPFQRMEDSAYSNNSPVKTDKSLEDVLGNLNMNTTITPQMMNLGLSQELMDEIWRQQTVLRLLQLIELPLLESLLEGQESPRPPLHSMDSDPDLLYTSSYLDREILKAFSEAQADSWLSAAVDCQEFLPDQLVVDVSRGLAKCEEETSQYKQLLYGVLVQHYGQSDYPPLLTNHVFDIHSGVSELLVNGKCEQALESLQLCLKLQDSRSREELRRLLRFMALAGSPHQIKLHKEIENRMAVKRAFSNAIVYGTKLAKGKVDLLVLFMMDKHHDLFKIPVTLHKLVSDKLASIIKGTDPDRITGTTYCRHLSGKEFVETVQKTTREELWTLLKTIHENTKLSLKEKRRLLGQFYKGHPEIFVQYFGNRISNIYI
ncbi:DEP domain-containing protein 7 [Danio rerio]|uniref:DEP domain-containing protein 7 n=1 Tax=Danio rerio TaxID=7955 RepID=DEPD7_DANRE|nr:DEP domain-containing protein 7 [Danio rerio]Q1JQ19.1 RecName: Full=DEP domain-containing protein 7 [Danio rerio]AAI16518.1 Zgc:136359 [Danio rerio]|eukprot:NP_001038734.1 DEP domain-containing protein 7 [Danio rerio]